MNIPEINLHRPFGYVQPGDAQRIIRQRFGEAMLALQSHPMVRSVQFTADGFLIVGYRERMPSGANGQLFNRRENRLATLRYALAYIERRFGTTQRSAPTAIDQLSPEEAVIFLAAMEDAE